MATRVAGTEDLNLRPLKRLRIDSCSSQMTSSSSRGGTQTPPTSISPPPAQYSAALDSLGSNGKGGLSYIPSSKLLLNLPKILLHPPTHHLHAQSLSLARNALKQCLTLELQPPEECHAWTGLAELGLMWLDVTGGEGLSEVEQAITKALLISQKHPTLRLYTPYLNILSARLAQQHQANTKFATNTLRRAVSSVSQSSLGITAPHIVFGTHLALVHSYSSAVDEESYQNHSNKGKGKYKERNNALHKCLGALQDMLSQAKMLSTTEVNDEAANVNLVVLLVLVIRLQLLVKHGVWSQVKQTLEETEKAFNLYESYGGMTDLVDAASLRSGSPSPVSQNQNHPRLLTKEPPACHHAIPPNLKIHLLILSVLFHTYAGNATTASDQLRILHELLDSGVLNIKRKKEGWNEAQDGVIEIHFPIPHTYPLRVLSTPPRVLNALAFLVSAVAKRDPVGRAPKKGVFARAGMALKDFEVRKSFGGPEWDYGEGEKDRRRADVRMERIRADLMAEVVSISIMRSEFVAAALALDELIAHTRSHDIFSAYAARIALQHAQLLHARGDTTLALERYQVVSFIAGEGSCEAERDELVRTAARAGEVWIRVGLLRTASIRRADDTEPEKAWGQELHTLRKLGGEVVRECEGLGGTLMAVGGMLKACLTEEFIGAKHHLRESLDLATSAQDNHLRAVILALISAHYQHTARDHAMSMLGTCSQLAAGLGAVKRDSGNPTGASANATNVNDAMPRPAEAKMQVGNLELRLWAGERMLELHRWAGEAAIIERQEYVNAKVREALQARKK